MAFSGFNANNIWDYGDNTAVANLAQQEGLDRDDLLTQRSGYLQPLYGQYRTAMQGTADEGDANLFNDPRFREFARTGQVQQAAQGSSAAPPASPRDTALQQVSQTYSSSTPFLGGMRDALMSQLGNYSQPVNANDSQLAPIASAMRLENQRAAERKRSQLAAQLNHPDMNLGDSGAFDAGVSGILQAQGEANARGIGQLLQGELGRRGQLLQGLLGMGLQSGEAEAGRNLSAYQGDQANQRYYAGLGENSRQFDAGLGQNQSQFEDRMGYDYNALNQQGNLQALLAMLNAV